MLGIGAIGTLNEAIASGKGQDIVLLQEALMEARIGNLAAQIAEDGKKKFILIAGPSSSGKTSFANRLSIQLQAKGLKPYPLSLDDYYADREFCPRNPDGSFDFECLEALDVELFNQNMSKLLNGEEIDVNAKELEVLKCLLDNNGQVLTRMQIIDYVWKDSEETPYDRVIDVYIKELRKKLQLDCITTIRNVGYKLESK